MMSDTGIKALAERVRSGDWPGDHEDAYDQAGDLADGVLRLLEERLEEEPTRRLLLAFQRERDDLRQQLKAMKDAERACNR